ncbi:DNA polymerase V [Pantoea dispersa]|nr:DNA polymerase V [Pantoea sp. B_9]KAA6113287.1 DNA polymerase V [Pantoea sp. B_10]QZY92148.1 DNA polymerase V [Pantoea dispersa]
MVAIHNCFQQVVKRDVAGRYIISTFDLIKELDRLSWHQTLRVANQWIEMHTTVLRDIMTTAKL